MPLRPLKHGVEPVLAAGLGISRAGAYELVRSEGFPALKIGSRIVVPKEKFIGWIDTQTVGGCKLPKIEKKEMKVLQPEQIGTYLQEANRRGLLPAYYLELTSGLRRGELLAFSGLTWMWRT